MHHFIIIHTFGKTVTVFLNMSHLGSAALYFSVARKDEYSKCLVLNDKILKCCYIKPCKNYLCMPTFQ